jgi:hypothetical protein
MVGTWMGSFGSTMGAADPYSAIAMFAIKGVSSMLDTMRKMKLINARRDISISSVLASFERKKNEWELGLKLAEQDSIIAAAQIHTADDELRLQQQEQAVAGMRADHADAIVDFLSRKFTGFDLYDWMSGILGPVYRYFLQQATSTAQAASRQLAFERQEPLTRFVQADYWVPPATNGGQPEDRMGMTGSARLTQAIYQLDQYAFQTDRQRHQIVKVISLSMLDPYAFEEFRRTGVLRFTTPLELFDRDFPGHYLRLIRRVRTGVIALIPPIHGVRAVLSASGLSRVVVGEGDDFRTVVIRREPESVALSSPFNASGLFELEAQTAMPYPFEFMGVDTSWELRLPRASNAFDYATLADVLLTIEYTALENPAFGRHVTRMLSRRPLVADRPFSFRHELADTWYDLNNSDPAATSIPVTFETRAADFPPNLEELKIERVLLSFTYAGDRNLVMPVEHLNFIPKGGTPIAGGPGASNAQGLISSRNGGGGPGWSQFKAAGAGVVGTWELVLPNTQQVRDRFRNEEIENIVFVITYAARLPDWPA